MWTMYKVHTNFKASSYLFNFRQIHLFGISNAISHIIHCIITKFRFFASLFIFYLKLSSKESDMDTHKQIDNRPSLCISWRQFCKHHFERNQLQKHHKQHLPFLSWLLFSMLSVEFDKRTIGFCYAATIYNSAGNNDTHHRASEWKRTHSIFEF